jgi:hypothetical protein
MADSLQDVAYPPELRKAEATLLGRPPRIGVAVSGGGIRSATFALGVFQALARLDLLRHIDCLSTVSGGSYFGAFFGRLFHRDYIQSHDDIRWVLSGPHDGKSPPREDPTLDRAGWKVLDWLRENGRYLSPRGAGDLLIGGAVLLRNWVSVHVVLGSFFLTTFLLLQLPRMVTYWTGGRGGPLAAITNVADAAMAYMPMRTVIWWSPWMLPAAIFALLAVPTGWAYWIIRDQHRFEPGALLGAVFCAIFGGLLALVAGPQSRVSRGIGIAMVIIAALTLVTFAMALWTARQPTRLDRTNAMRHNLSAWFKNAVIAMGIVLAFAVIDSLGQTIATWSRTGLPTWITGVGAIILTAAGFARQLAVLISPHANGKRVPLRFSVIATIIAVLLAAIILITVNATAHAIAWDFRMPNGPRADPLLFTTWLLGVAIITLVVGQAFSFLNYSSYQSLYAARLIRAYLGASNDARWMHKSRPVTEPIRGDDLNLYEYWPLDEAGAGDAATATKTTVYDKGAPLHFVNVTINETFDGESQVQQQDRKGVGMALGPAGVSAGIRHHAVFGRLLPPATKNDQPAPEVAHVYPVRSATNPHAFCVFDFDQGRQGQEQQRQPQPQPQPQAQPQPQPIRFPGEPLSLGHWVGISGAAFSTGTGFRTSLGLSLLAGMGNVRLGYWWNSHVDRAHPTNAVARFGIWLRRSAYTVQHFILSELVARFPGTAHRRWYLSDGGHFENLGGYELIRRRLPLIIVIDSEEDADYTFQGLANLIRKARLDFHTEITFKQPEGGLAGSPKYQELFASNLDDLRPTASDGATPTDPAHLRYSNARCALAQIEYPPDADTGKRQEGWLLYIKPTLRGDEPSDITQYARAHHPFPQQSTRDQFFDEAQWESYRKLGDHIASAIFDAPPFEPGEPSPHQPWTLQQYGLIPNP